MSPAPDRRLAIASGNRSVPVGHCSALSAARSRRLVWRRLPQAGRCDGDHGSRHRATLTLAERIRRARDRFDSPRVSRLHRDLQRAPSAPRPLLVRRLLPPHPHASFTRQGLPGPTPGHATQDRKSRRHPASQWPASPLRTSRRLIRSCSQATNRASPPDTFYRKVAVAAAFRPRLGAERFKVLIAACLI